MSRGLVRPVRTEKGGHNDFTETHPAYAMIGASRVSASPPGKALYGSDFLHQHYVVITVVRSDMGRGISNDWYHGTDHLLEIAVSEAQWATFVSAMNVGHGVPGTLQWLPGEDIPGILRDESRRQLHRDETEKHMKDAIASLTTLRDAAPTKKLRELAEQAIRDVTDGVPWVTEQFEEAAERTIEKAKIEINAYATKVFMEAGIASLRAGQEPFLRLADPEDDASR